MLKNLRVCEAHRQVQHIQLFILGLIEHVKPLFVNDEVAGGACKRAAACPYVH